MVEVEVTRLEYAHDLNALSRFAVEGDRGGLHELGEEPLQGDDIHLEGAAVDEVGHAVKQGVHAEESL